MELRGLFSFCPQGILREAMRQHHANPIDRCSSTDYGEFRNTALLYATMSPRSTAL